jgi:hypothetical protein
MQKSSAPLANLLPSRQPAAFSSVTERHYYKQPPELPNGIGKFLVKNYFQVLLHL